MDTPVTVRSTRNGICIFFSRGSWHTKRHSNNPLDNCFVCHKPGQSRLFVEPRTMFQVSLPSYVPLKTNPMQLREYDRECIQKAKEIIDANFRNHHPIGEIATMAGISSTRLKAGFKQMYGKGLYGYLHEGALLKAQSLLQYTDKTIKEISRTVGYRYPNNFGSAFKKQFGMTPAKWRRTLAQKCPIA